MEKRKPTRLKRLATGCGLLILAVVLVVGIGIFRLTSHYNKAYNTRTELAEQFGERDQYDPGAGPVITPDQFNRFLRVRHSLAGMCMKFSVNNQNLEGFNEFDKREDVPRGLIIKQGLKTTASMFGMARGLADLAIIRNEALLEQEMGLGEYIWIYTLSYYGALGQDPVLGMTSEKPGQLAGGISSALQAMISQRVAALGKAAAVLPEGNDERARQQAEAEIWRQAGTDLAAKPGRFPFTDEVPGFLWREVEPFRSQLEETFCPATDPMELLRIKKMGGGYEDR